MKAFRRGSKVVMQHDNAMTEPWAMRVGWSARQAMRAQAPIAGPVSVRLHFYLPRPKRMKRELPHVKPDVDKLIRAVLDALTGIVWVDDGQVVQVTGQKVYADPPGVGMEPCVHIIVHDIDGAEDIEPEGAL